MDVIGGLGRLPDPPDDRDYRWRSVAVREVQTVPLTFRIGAVGRVLDQGDTPQCVAYTSATVKLHQEWRDHRRYYDFDPADLYALCKQIDGYAGEGTYFRAAATQMSQEGMLARAARGELRADTRFKIGAYVRLKDLHQIKEALSFSDSIVALGMDVDTAWSGRAIGPDGHIGLPTGEVVGGHEVAVVGYDDSIECLEIKNSWGEGWGSALYRHGYTGGFAWLPYSHLERYADWDAWSCLDLDGAP